MQKKSVCLVGLGSIGLTHLKQLSGYFHDFIIIDKNIEVSKKIEQVLGKRKYLFASEINEISPGKNISHAVISNWGPSHYETLCTLINLGVKRFIIEKPITDSIAELFKIKKLKNQLGLQIFINFQWSYSSLFKKLEVIRNKFKLGEMVSINVTGGAKCIATNGIHYLDLSNKLFNEKPIKTFSDLYNSHLNPRQSDFLFLGGSATWVYSKNKYLNINFSNGSRISPRMEIIFEFGIAVIEGEELSISYINKTSLDDYKSPTKTFYPSKIAFSGRAFTYSDGTDGLNKIHAKFSSNQILRDNFNESYNSTLDFFATLISSHKGSSVELPLRLSRYSRFYFKKWNIS